MAAARPHAPRTETAQTRRWFRTASSMPCAAHPHLLAGAGKLRLLAPRMKRIRADPDAGRPHHGRMDRSSGRAALWLHSRGKRCEAVWFKAVWEGKCGVWSGGGRCGQVKWRMMRYVLEDDVWIRVAPGWMRGGGGRSGSLGGPCVVSLFREGCVGLSA